MPLFAAAPLQSQNIPAPSPAPQAPAAQAPAPETSSPRSALGIVVIDAAHGGTDSGARGESGIEEKEIVASLAQSMKRELERQGLRVVLTRTGDATFSFDDRAAIANALPGAVFVTLHVASLGEPGTAIAYSLADIPAGPPASDAPGGNPAATSPPPNNPREQPAGALPAFLIPWQDAQLRFIAESRRLAELLQIQLAQKFKGSPEFPQRGAVRQLRLVGRPAVAIEIASVALPQRQQLERMGPGLAEAFLRALEAFRRPGEAGKP
jgi:N-acetylmuramoyl-L-alanine amidase